MKVAIVKLSALGDVVHALPVAAALRAARPAVRITWLVEPRNAPVLAGHPAIHDVITVDTRRWRRARRPAALLGVGREIAALRRRLRATRFDVAIDLQDLVKSGVLTRMTGAPLRVGFDAAYCRERASALFTNRHVRPPTAARHVVDQYLSLLSALSITPAARAEFRLPCDEAAETSIDEAFAASGLKARDRLVVVNPGAGRPEKRWPLDRFAGLAARLARDVAARVLVVWGPAERPMAEAIAESGGATLAPPTDLLALLAVLRRASVVVAADTGPLHLAAALGVPCIGLFGPTSAVRNGPYGSGHRALQAADGAMRSLDVDTVARAVTEALA
jgi:lipopolysaccharide heptosyltransferase I